MSDDLRAKAERAWEEFKEMNPPKGQAAFYYKDNCEYWQAGYHKGYLERDKKAEELVLAIDELEAWAIHAHMLAGPIAKCVRLFAKYRGGSNG